MLDNDFAKITTLGRIRFSCEKVLEYMKKLPQVTVPLLSKELGLTAPTARSSLNRMVDIGILEEITNQKRDKVYVYRIFKHS